MKVPFFANKNGSWIRATPAYDGQSLFVAGMQDVLVCLDGASGKERWRVDFIRQFNTPTPKFGYVSSPLVTTEHVYVQAGASVCKLDKENGKVLWRTLKDEGGMNGSAFSSPVLTRLAGREQLIVLSRSHLNGIDPESGEVLWTTPIKAFRGMNILTPLVYGDAVFTAAYGGRAQLLDIRSDDEVCEVSARWDTRLQGYMTSPVLINGCAYFFTRSNRFACVRLEDGEIMWISPPTGDEYWSLVAQGDRILALTDSGELKLISANPEAFEVIDDRPLADAASWAHLAVAGNQIVVREQNALAIYQWN
jgi:outer membrane protein assembly factor BamB